MKKVYLIIFILTLNYSANYAQNITNTLGPGGLFSLKYGTTSFFSLSQTDSVLNINYGLNLPNTSSSNVGVLNMGTSRFLHNYGISNTFLGTGSGNFTMSGGYNIGIGPLSLLSNTTGSQNIGIGPQSLFVNNTGTNNIAIGYQSLASNTTGSNNTAIGIFSLVFNSSGSTNTAIGTNSQFNTTTGNFNTSVGYNSSYSNQAGFDNTSVGYQSLYYNTGTNFAGNDNSALGYLSLYSNTIGAFNTAVGSGSLYSNTSGNQNASLGYESLYSNTDGQWNTSLGFESLFSNTHGTFNTAVGYFAGSLITTGFNNTLIGNNSEPTTGSASNQITLGNGNVTSLRCAVTTITSLSDARDKKNIKDLSLGLDFLMKLKPRQFNWDKREWYDNNISDGSKMKETPTAGFIAQELDSVQTTQNAEWLNLVLKDNPEKLEATSGNLLPVIVKAIQELKVENDKLKTENNEMKSRLEALEKSNEKITVLEKMILEMKEQYVKEIKLTQNKEK